MIRKEGKARWVYECPTCGLRVVKPDLFRVIEAQQKHEKSLAHAFRPLINAFGALAHAATESAGALKLFSGLQPVINRPHDPTLWTDKRKWGGR